MKYSIGSDEIHENWGSVWDCLVEACFHEPELNAILDLYKTLPDRNHIAIVNCLINHFFTDNSMRLIVSWGFGDTEAKDQMYLDIKAKLGELKPYLENYTSAM